MTSSRVILLLHIVLWYLVQNIITTRSALVDPSHKSHNALIKHLTMLHFVTELHTWARFCYKMTRCGIWATDQLLAILTWLCPLFFNSLRFTQKFLSWAIASNNTQIQVTLYYLYSHNLFICSLLFKNNGILLCGGKIWCLFLRYRLEILCVVLGGLLHSQWKIS